MSSFYSEEELSQLGLKAYGKDVLLSRKTSIYGAENISLGNHVRIDDFCILSGNITLHDYVHIAAYVSMFAGETGIEVEDFGGISSRTAVYAESDDYSGEAMINPTVPDKCRKLHKGKVSLGKHVTVGTGCTLLPGVTIAEGATVGAMSLITKDLEPWTINVGIPCKKVKERSKKLLEYEKYIIDKNIEE